MIKNGKYFVLPINEDRSFKEIFKKLTTEGAGRPVDNDGFPLGPWTPELLAEAISQIDANRGGIELRTVQLWFQDNERGVSKDNIRWLGRVFGCDDPVATRDLQKVLGAAQSRLAAKRREVRARKNDAKELSQGFSLARRSEALLSNRSHLDLPVLVFAGAVVLGFLAYILDIHSVVYGPEDGPVKQVGFIWAPNWTALFLMFMPLYLAFVTELLVFWKDEGRSKFLVVGDKLFAHDARKSMESEDGWALKVEAFSYSYWAIFLVCFALVFLFQWIDVCLVPLITGDIGNFAVDWGRIAIIRPEVISVPVAIAFTGLAYLFMSLCVFLFFVGLVLLYTVAHDLWEIGRTSERRTDVDYAVEVREVGLKIMCGIYRGTVLGLLITICLKLQSTFLQSGGETIVSWLVVDLLSVLGVQEEVNDGLDYNILSDFSSLLTVLAICAVFLSSLVRIHAVMASSRPSDATYASWDPVPWWRMMGVVALLVASFLLIGVFAGFSILLSVGVLLALYSLIDPEFGQGHVR